MITYEHEDADGDTLLAATDAGANRVHFQASRANAFLGCVGVYVNAEHIPELIAFLHAARVALAAEDDTPEPHAENDTPERAFEVLILGDGADEEGGA